MKLFINYVLRLPLDLIFLFVDWLRAIPECAYRVAGKRKACPFCEIAVVDSNAAFRRCPAAERYGNVQIFRAVCPCAQPADETHPEPYCRARDAYRRQIWSWPVVGVGLALMIGLCTAGIRAILTVRTTDTGRHGKLASPSETPLIDVQSTFDRAADELDRANAALEGGDYGTARICYLNARKIYPKSAWANYGLGKCYFYEGQLANAEEAFEQALDLDPDIAEIHLDLAKVYAHQLKLESALRHAIAHRALSPDDPRAYLYLMRVFDETEQPTEAIEAAIAFAGMAQTNVSELAEVGDFLRRSGEGESARFLYDDILKRAPDHPEGLQGLVRLHLLADEFEQARTLLDHAASVHTNDIRIELLEADLLLAEGKSEAALDAYASMHDRLVKSPGLAMGFAQRLASTGQTEAARKIAERIAHSSHPRLELDANLMLARMALVDRSFVDARRYAEAALVLRPNEVPAKLILAQCQLTNREFEDAELTVRSILALKPEHVPARAQLAQVLRAAGKWDEAVAEMKAVAELLPENEGPWLRLCQHYFLVQAHAETVEAAKQVLARKPDSIVALNRLTLAHIAMGAMGEAEAVVRPAYAQFPDAPRIQHAYGWWLVAQGKEAEALPLLEQAGKGLRGPVLSYHLGVTHAQVGQVQEAKQHLTDALAFRVDFPGSANAKARLQTLSKAP